MVAKKTRFLPKAGTVVAKKNLAIAKLKAVARALVTLASKCTCLLSGSPVYTPDNVKIASWHD
ncbi:MAG: hypothetical protein HPY50_11960 [Firmicutes bacterium]|nr:hypothetical protein [Bacillota bacterium]